MSAKPIVVGVDGSEQSLQAVEWAALEARRHGLPLRVVSALAAARVHTYHGPATAVATALRDVAARALDVGVRRSEEVAPGLFVTTGLLSGSPAPAVAECGSDASMLVVGARGGGGFASIVLGSVSRYVAAHAPCPVVVVREEVMAVHREVAVGVRDPSEADHALAFAFEEAALRRADLVAIHAWYWFPSGLRTSAEPAGAPMPTVHPEHISAEIASSLSAALDRWRDKYPRVRVRPDVINGNPAHALATYTTRADLVVLGRHADPGEGTPGIGSIRHAVLDHARGPVAVVP
jgi:nucleotide-binding universal stress UspA family protein